MNKICDVCGAPFITPPHHPNQLRCSPACKKEAKRKWKGSARPHEQICDVCGATFITLPNNPNQKRCSLACRLEAKQRWKRESAWKYRGQEQAQTQTKICDVCGKSFAPHTNQKRCSPDCDKEFKRRDSLHRWHGEWGRAYRQTSKYKETNRKRVREFNQTEKGKEYRVVQQHRRKARLKDLPQTYTAMEWRDDKARFDYHCAYCGKELSRFHQDHIVALINGGPYIRGNILPSCDVCNTDKSSNDLVSWYPGQPFYTRERLIKIYEHIKEFESEYTRDLVIRIKQLLETPLLTDY